MSGHLLRNMILFGRLLRAVGLSGVTTSRIEDWVEAAGLIDLGSRADFRSTAQAILVTRREDLEWFRAAFDLFFVARDPRELAEMDLGMLVQRVRRRVERSVAQRPGADGAEGEGVEPPQTRRVYTWSDLEALRRKDFAELEGRELVEVREMIRRMQWQLDVRSTRRRVPSRRGRLDLRRSLRKNLSRGGEIVEWARRDRKRKRRPLALLCDISGSMEPYSRILLQFLYVASRGLDRTEAFVFGTRLTRITRQLRHRDVDQALRAVHHEVQDFGGGTRIGEAVRSFNRLWSRRVLGQGAAVLIISDGWDRGEPDVLEREMARLQRSAYRVLWLNPLLGSPRYEPLTRGLQAALPFVDDFLPVHNLESLEDLGRRLRRLRPGRRGERAGRFQLRGRRVVA
ncbi:MAG TPA: VWA domain-containing protein [Thermoanaerobaculia bacterium]|nr:VWA domain-containing protein [Thermoanaerobaculia bacterium]